MTSDIFRDTWVRYLGYANEVGEAFRPVVTRGLVRFTYKVAFGYVLADTTDKSWKEFKRTWAPNQAMIEAGDALLWQTLASVIIPGFTINRISKYTEAGLYAHRARLGLQLGPRSRRALVVVVALAAVPLVVHPIDAAVTAFMNLTYRQYFKDPNKENT